VVTCLSGAVPLHSQGAVVDPNVLQSSIIEESIAVLGPLTAPFPKKLRTVPFPGLDWIQALRRRPPQGEHDVGMMVARVIALRSHGTMDGDVSYHAALDKMAADKGTYQIQPLGI